MMSHNGMKSSPLWRPSPFWDGDHVVSSSVSLLYRAGCFSTHFSQAFCTRTNPFRTKDGIVKAELCGLRERRVRSTRVRLCEHSQSQTQSHKHTFSCQRLFTESQDATSTHVSQDRVLDYIQKA
jgi:hypothetical protein